jgi:hypothetical protein
MLYNLFVTCSSCCLCIFFAVCMLLPATRQEKGSKSKKLCAVKGASNHFLIPASSEKRLLLWISRPTCIYRFHVWNRRSYTLTQYYYAIFCKPREVAICHTKTARSCVIDTLLQIQERAESVEYWQAQNPIAHQACDQTTWPDVRVARLPLLPFLSRQEARQPLLSLVNAEISFQVFTTFINDTPTLWFNRRCCELPSPLSSLPP